MTTTSLKTLLESFVEEQAVGRVGTCTGVGSTTTLIDATRFGGPFQPSEWPRGSPIRMTGNGNRAGQKSYVSNYAPATGTLTLDPAMTNASQATDTFVIAKREVCDDIDRMIEALNRGLRRHCKRRVKVPFTYCAGGDLMGSASDWLGVNASITYVEQAHPNAPAQRVMKVQASADGGYATQADTDKKIQVHPGEVWEFWTFGRAPSSAAGTLEFWDRTNTVEIEARFSQGAKTIPVTTLAYVDLRGEFTIPAGCFRLETRQTSSLSGYETEWGPLIMRPRGASRYTSAPHLQSLTRVGDFWTVKGGKSGATSGLESYAFEPVELGYTTQEQGWGFDFSFDESPPFPLFYDELLVYGALTAEADTTACPEELALAAMAYEFFKWADKDASRRGQDDKWVDELNEAWSDLRAARRTWGTVPDLSIHREYSGVASA